MYLVEVEIKELDTKLFKKLTFTFNVKNSAIETEPKNDSMFDTSSRNAVVPGLTRSPSLWFSFSGSVRVRVFSVSGVRVRALSPFTQIRDRARLPRELPPLLALCRDHKSLILCGISTTVPTGDC